MQPLEVKTLELDSGEVPFESWLDSLGDVRLQAAVAARLARVRAGQFCDATQRLQNGPADEGQ